MRLTGQGVSPGIGIGRAIVITRGTRNLRFRIPERRVAREIDRLDTARAQSRAQIDHIRRRIADAAGADHAYIFDAQRLMLENDLRRALHRKGNAIVTFADRHGTVRFLCF